MSSELRKLWEHAGGRLPDDWTIEPLEAFFRDTKSIAVGVMYPGPDTPGGTPLLKVGDIKDGAALRPSYCISAATDEEHRRTKLIGDELLITLVGNPGECVVVTPDMAGWNPARAIAVIRLQDTSLRTYLKTVLESTAGRHLIDAVLNTTVQKTLNLKDIRKLPIPLPTDAEIKWISGVSEALTSRITLLRETNATLEAIAQALFKSWFVDFDPVRAKMEGRAPEGMDEATAAMFPDGFEESELGLVPRGWCSGSVLCLVSETSARVGIKPALVLSAVQTGHLVRSAEHFTKRVHSEDISKYKAVPPFAFAYNPSRINIGSIGMNEFAELGAVSPIYVVMAPRDIPKSFFLWHHLRTNRVRDAIISMSSGTVRQSLAFRDFASLPIVIPPDSLLMAFHELRMRLYESHAMNERLASTLSEARDTLLPRLISGQLRLPEAQEELEVTLP